MPDPLGDLSYTWPFYAAVLLGYLVGSIPFGLVLTKLAGLQDIRSIGSGSIGATNVLRTGKKGLALATLLLDGSKGAAVVLIANHLYTVDYAVLAAGGALIGHCFPIWLKFIGGKGVATGLGILLAATPLIGLIACLIWLAVAMLFRYSSLSALITFAAIPFATYYLVDIQHAELAGFLAVVIWLRHYENIRRLLKGKESKITGKKISN
ncbi:MAG: acyl-phosphate glycerol 3-phosphate acyltransferase [Rhodospirillaceae bacterium]|nr:acyl-phosphate glycerol 3-phosphate acyltransferase [Rhodospirillaceae bacterium]